MSRTRLDVSIVVPVHNEALSLPLLWAEIAAVLDAHGWAAEVIFVDDGSTDESSALVRRLLVSDPRVRLVRFSANAGLSAAFDAGLKRARGRYVVTMDADLQNDPRDITLLLAHLDRYDAATGYRQHRQDSRTKRISSRLANAIRNAVTGDEVRDSACSLRAMRRDCVGALDLYAGLHRFVPTLLRMRGYRVAEVPVHHRPRRFGRSHFGIRNRAWRAFCDLLVVRWMLGNRLEYEIEEGAPVPVEEPEHVLPGGRPARP